MATASPQIRNFRIGRMEQSDTLGIDYHDAARNGNKKKLKKIIGRGIQIDYPNDQGQSPLFIACFENEPSACDLLLSNGANPNERSNAGTTPVHMAAYSGNVKLLSDVLAAGGDLRFHDNLGRTTKDWALCQPEPKRRMKMLEFLEKTKLFALTTSGRDIRVGNKMSSHVHVNKNNSLMHIIKNKIKGGIDANIDQLKSSHSMGFGKVYLDGDSSSGFMTSIPLISESCLRHNGDGLTFENGAFMVMESIHWQSTKVTAKRLHREAEAGGEVDLLITEAEFVGKLRHPDILLLMGICQTNNLDGLVLLFENVGVGSLYYQLHEKSERMSTNQIHEILVQICDGIIFLHDQDLLHCYITSHAVFLVSSHTAKLGNLEYAIERNKSEVGKRSLVISNKHQNAAYNWMAPEIINGSCPSAASDMYSFCAVMWESFENTIPWGKCDAATIRQKMFNDGEQLPLSSGRTPQLYLTLMEYGLQLDPQHRQLSFNHVRDILGLSTEKVKQYISNLSPKQQPLNGNRETITEQEISNSRQKSNRETGRVEGMHARDQTQQSSWKPQRPKSPPDGQKAKRHDQNQSSREKKHRNESSPAKAKVSPNKEYAYKSQDGVAFDIKNTHWDLQEEQNQHEYHYRVKVLPKKEKTHSPQQKYNQHQRQQISNQKHYGQDYHQQHEQQQQISDQKHYRQANHQQHEQQQLELYEKQRLHQGYDQQHDPKEYEQQTYDQQSYEKQDLQQTYNQHHHQQGYGQQQQHQQAYGKQHQRQMYDHMLYDEQCDVQTGQSQYEPESRCGKASPDKVTGNITSSESEESCNTQTSSSQDTEQQLNTSLAKPLATRFSYLQINQVRSPTGVSVKPASHSTAPFETIEKDTEKTLSNAGSVFALYNMDCFEGKESTPNRQPISKQNQHYSTMPRKRKRMGMTPEIKNDTKMLLKQPGSVRNLVDLYQHQESSHKLKQAVLHGNIKDCMDGDNCIYPSLDDSDIRSDKEIKSPNCNNHGMNQHNCSGVKPMRKMRNPSPAKKVDKAYHASSPVNDVMNSSSLTTVSPCDSASNARIRSPLFDDSQHYDSVPCKTKAKQGKKKGNKKTEVEEFYFDDELNQDLEEHSNIQLQSPLSSPPVSYGLKARKSSFIITPQTCNEFGETKLRDGTDYNQSLCIERYQQSAQPSQVTNTGNFSHERPAYVSTVTISSNLKDPEKHDITHTLTDLDNGATNTMYRKSIRASRVVSSLFGQ
ncbi:probable serine/threonine-protein kinase DDB_G0280133 isoform X2 [Mizuhopecten yessoensis]|uniref:probable serine/threonine-protein kinase DDB_G0280133 isoform X2 n=1 Tax=Mizuhopecten yessoensis TaxID=6573 RepID=UPI000B45E047|nr:probable serine/threonine-protein kinase DDB_G0280133 isoform X2 [Mizuhopecten yessoensis]